MDYALLDSGNGQKLERFGDFLLIRPCAQAVWHPTLPEEEWEKAHAFFEREKGNRWIERTPLPSEWKVTLDGITFKLKKTEFGHLGIFPEHASHWKWIRERLLSLPSARVLNLFAYSGGTTLAAAAAGAQVCHVDAAHGMIAWARENALLSGLDKAPIRWIVDDVRKFLSREVNRKAQYEGIILDPPSFGRGKSGEVFKIERDLLKILMQCREILSDRPSFVLFSCHTPGYTPLVMEQLLQEYFSGGRIEAGEMVLSPLPWKGKKPFFLPCGTFVRWSYE